MNEDADFIHQVIASETWHPDGTRTVQSAPAVWTLAHRGYSGGARLDVWAYRSEEAAEYDGARLALSCGLDEDETAVELFAASEYRAVMARYEQMSPDYHLLRVQPAFLNDMDVPD